MDADTYTTCEGDCDDARDDVYPDAPETCGDGIDNNCDAEIALLWDDPFQGEDGDDYLPFTNDATNNAVTYSASQDALRILNNQDDLGSRAVADLTVYPGSGITASFDLRFRDDGDEGLTFGFLSATADLSGTWHTGSGLAYTDVGHMSVEFDTKDSGSYDPSSDHVGVDITSENSLWDDVLVENDFNDDDQWFTVTVELRFEDPLVGGDEDVVTIALLSEDGLSSDVFVVGLAEGVDFTDSLRTTLTRVGFTASSDTDGQRTYLRNVHVECIED